MPEDHFNACKVIIDKEIQTGESEGATVPYQKVRVITVNGQIWEKSFYPFGLDETRIRADWDLRQLKTWRKIEFTPSSEQDKK